VARLALPKFCKKFQGNLILVTNLLETPYEPDTRGEILLLEKIGENPTASIAC
jgi:muramoyltetrapeptide carboxypeptidase LdcA involved in peptidoglycan recycling